MTLVAGTRLWYKALILLLLVPIALSMLTSAAGIRVASQTCNICSTLVRVSTNPLVSGTLQRLKVWRGCLLAQLSSIMISRDGTQVEFQASVLCSLSPVVMFPPSMLIFLVGTCRVAVIFLICFREHHLSTIVLTHGSP